MTRRLLLSFTLLLLSGCAGEGTYPSLAPRPIETISTAEPEAPPPPQPAAADAALGQRIAAILKAAEDGAAAFRTTAAEARPAISAAAGAEAGSERWVAGQQALSRVDAARGVVQAAAADFDALRLAEINRTEPADIAAIEAAGQRIEALLDEQNRLAAELAAMLP